jgi:hypothetical protein
MFIFVGMKASELRIGNYVFCLETNSVQRITGLTSEMPFIDAITFDYRNYDEIEPIPLNEEWLIKLGFQTFHKNDWSVGGENSNELIHAITITTYYKTPICRVRGKDVPFIYYVHQLQNLYFALTLKELEIKKGL